MTMSTRSFALIVWATLFILTTACTAGGAQPQPTTAPSTTKAPRPTVAPAVTRTLDLTPVWGKPCAPISADLLSDIGLTSPTDVSVRKDIQFCVWTGPQDRPRLAISMEQHDLLGDVYRKSNGPWGEYFQPTTVAGQPAVVYGVNPKPQHACNVVIGTGPTQGIDITAGSIDESPVDWCAKALVAAMQVVQYLGG